MNRYVLVCCALLILALSAGGCASTVMARPKGTMVNIAPSPATVSYNDIVTAYRQDALAADALYKNKRWQLNDITVELISRTGGSGASYYFEAGQMRFQPRYFNGMDYLSEGAVATVVGECRGMMLGYIYFDDCWVETLSGGRTSAYTY